MGIRAAISAVVESGTPFPRRGGSWRSLIIPENPVTAFCFGNGGYLYFKFQTRRCETGASVWLTSHDVSAELRKLRVQHRKNV